MSPANRTGPLMPTRTLEPLPLSREIPASDLKKYSLMRAITAAVAAAQGDPREWGRSAGLEREVSDHLARQLDRKVSGFLVPAELPVPFIRQKRVMNVTTGAEVIATDHLAASFIDTLRAESLVGVAGATYLPGLTGDVDIPRLTASATFAWLADDEVASDTDVTFDQAPLTPRTVAGSVAMSRRLLKQSSPGIDALVATDLARGAALAIDLAALKGDGLGNSPTGITNTTDVQTQTVADLVDKVPTWAEAVGFVTKLEEQNVDDGSMAFVCHPGVVGGMKTTPKDPGSGRFVMSDKGEVAGIEVLRSSQLSAGRTILGSWSNLLVGMWGALEVTPDPAAKAASGGLVLRVFQDVDIAVRHHEAFCINA